MIEAPQHCPVCGDMPSACFRLASREIVRSPGCGLEWQRPFPGESELQALYGGDYFRRWGIDSPGALARVRAAKEDTYRALLEEARCIGPGRRLLDVGCAFGFLQGVAERLGLEAYGLDLNREAIAVARAEFGARVHCGPLDARAFPGLSFDVVTLIDVLEHVPDPGALLTSVAARLARGAVAVAVLPNAASTTRRILGRRWPHYAPEHLWHWTPTAIRRFLEAAGWRVLRLRTGVRKTFTVGYLRAYARALGRWAPPAPAWAENLRLRIPTGEMLVVATPPEASCREPSRSDDGRTLPQAAPRSSD